MASRCWDGGSLSTVMDSDGTHDPSTGGFSSCMYSFKINVVRKEAEEDTYGGRTDFYVHSESLARRRSRAPSARMFNDKLVASTVGVFGCKWDGEGIERGPSCYFAFWFPSGIHRFGCDYMSSLCPRICRRRGHFHLRRLR